MLTMVLPALQSIGVGIATSLGMKALGETAKDAVEKRGSKSIAQYTGVLRSEPICMIDREASNNEYIEDVMKTITSIYAAMYAQAFSIGINHTIGDVKVTKVLEAINPTRNKRGAISSMISSAISSESISLKLPKFTKDGISLESHPLNLRYGVSMENDNGSSNGNGNRNNDNEKRDPTYRGEVDAEAATKFASNLSTGVNLDLKFTIDGRDVTLPATIRLMANVINQSSLHNLLVAAVTNRTIKERWRDWRAGAIDFWKDAVLCRDLISEHRKALIKDQTGILHEVYARAQKNTEAGILTQNVSIAQVTNIMIITTNTLRSMEQKTGKKLSNDKVRQQIFENTQVMILAVIDPDMETVTFHYHSISVPTVATLKSLKGAAKSNLSDMTALMKTMQMGNGIRF